MTTCMRCCTLDAMQLQGRELEHADSNKGAKYELICGTAFGRGKQPMVGFRIELSTACYSRTIGRSELEVTSKV